jgi:tRNA uridine 5-carboxymethylaminomethyl modification enzyme
MPADLDYKSMNAMSYESREKLDRVRPATLGQAGRIDGVRAGDLAVLTVHLKKWRDLRDVRDAAGEASPSPNSGDRRESGHHDG